MKIVYGVYERHWIGDKYDASEETSFEGFIKVGLFTTRDLAFKELKYWHDEIINSFITREKIFLLNKPVKDWKITDDILDEENQEAYVSFIEAGFHHNYTLLIKSIDVKEEANGSSFKIIVGDAGVPVYDKNWDAMNFVEVKGDKDDSD